MEGKISVSYYPLIPDGVNKWGQSVKVAGENWIAEIWKPKHIQSEGPTPRDAIIALYKKLN